MIIRFRLSTILSFLALSLISLPVIALGAANYASTTIFVNVPTDTSFTMTILKCGATTISGTTEATATNTTGDISFNSTTANDKGVQAQSISGDNPTCTTPTVQNGLGLPIIQLQPAGNVNLNFTMKLDVSVPSDISIKVNGTLFNSTDGCLATGTTAVPWVNNFTLSTSYQILARIINKTSCIVNVTMYADFTNSPAGERRLGELITNGTNVPIT